MAEDKKKTKIDLKARLGRTTQMGIAPAPAPLPGGAGPTPPPPGSDPGGGAPPGSGPSPASAPISRPSAPASVRPPVPMGIAPPPGISQGIPLPPFGPQRQAARAEPKPSAAQQTIKVEIGEEIHEERKKWRTRVMLGVAAGVIVGGGIGFVAGGSQEKGERAKSAALGAGRLEKDVKAANEKLKDLDTKLSEAAEKIKSKAYPDNLSTALGGLTIPFDSLNLDGKGINAMPSKLFKMVLNYTASVENLNRLRESMRNVAVAAKAPLTKAWKEEAAPMANFSVIFRSDGGKVVADLVPNPAPFAWRGDFPATYKVTKIENNRPAEKEVKRYAKGDLPGNDLTGIPVDPKSTAAYASDANIGHFYKTLLDMRTVLQGNKDNPTTETPGLLKDGEDLVQELHKGCTAVIDASMCGK